MLDEFSAAKIDDEKKASTQTPAPPAAAATANTGETKVDEDEFAQELQAGMAQLLGQFQSNPEMQQELEKMMRELGQAATAQGGSAAAPELTQSPTKATANKSTPVQKTGEESFQDTIKKTMERMQNSGESASAAAATTNEDDMLAKMLKEMESGNFPGLEGGNEEDFNKMLMGMMEQLTNKDILYEPMKELNQKFPTWLESHQDNVKADDLVRYKEQQATVAKIVARFERPGYTDSNQADRDYIVDQMQKVSKPSTIAFSVVANWPRRCKLLDHLRRI